MKLGKAVVRSRVVILIIALALMVPSVIGMICTRVNYDMLNYLPESLDTVKGQKYMLEDFNKGAFSFLIFENADEKTMREASEKIKEVDHVATVLNFSDIADGAIPEELLPDKIYDAVNKGDDSLMAVFFDSSSSSDETISAITEIRRICDGQCLVSGISAMVTDLRDLCEREEAVYVGIAVVLAVAAMMLFLDNWIVPFVFLASIGMAILMNMGSNFFLGEISYITKALSAVLQLAVTMDYSIFLWSSYKEQKTKCSDNKEAMAKAIQEKWNEVNREKLSLYYDTKDKPAVPIEKNPELRSLKNMLIRTALSMNFNAQVTVNTARIGFLFSMLSKQIVNSAGKRLDELNKMMPKSNSKEHEKIRAKKLAHGQKEGADGYGTDDEVYDSQAAEGILTMLDYLISLGNQESKQDNEEQNTQTADEFNFDNTYAEYLNDEDIGHDDDLDDEDEEYFGLSM